MFLQAALSNSNSLNRSQFQNTVGFAQALAASRLNAVKHAFLSAGSFKTLVLTLVLKEAKLY
jgi:hypothetical protein